MQTEQLLTGVPKMPLLASIAGPGWRLDVETRTPPRRFVGVALASSHIRGPGTLTIYIPEMNAVVIENGVASHPPILAENVEYDFYLEADQIANVKANFPPATVLRKSGGNFLHYALNFHNDVGFFSFSIESDGRTTDVVLEVFPTKLDYRSDYVQIRDEVASIVRNLVIGIQARTYATATATGNRGSTLAEWTTLLKAYFSEYLKLATTIVEKPHTSLQRKTETKPIEKARHLDSKRLGIILRKGVRRPSGIVLPSGVILPRHLPELTRQTSYDTAENRHVKYLLSQTANRLQTIARTEESGDEDAELSAEQMFFRAFRPVALDMLRLIERLLQNSFLSRIQASPAPASGTQVLQKHPTYSAFTRRARLLNGGLSVTGGVLQIGLKNIAELYEYWCFLKLISVLGEQFQLEQLDFVQTRSTSVVVVLKKGLESKVRFRGKDGREIAVLYNRAFTNLPTLSQKPDNIIELTDGRTLHILDAKYKIASDVEYLRQFSHPGPTSDDINTMHRYRDAIVLPKVLGGEGFERGIVQDAVVLFPYANEQEYRDHRFFKSIDTVQIGGLPFLPRSTGLVREHLTQILTNDGIIRSSADGQDQPPAA
jgi:predicted component of viral defense system (DUF524 family)